MNFKNKLHNYLIYVLFKICAKFTPLKVFLCNLCDLEMQCKVMFNKNYLGYLENSDILNKGEEMSNAQRDIPEGFYCEECPFKGRSSLANLFFGSQSDGYCYYLGKGDFSYIHPTDLLWDSCKECGVNDNYDE